MPLSKMVAEKRIRISNSHRETRFQKIKKFNQTFHSPDLGSRKLY